MGVQRLGKLWDRQLGWMLFKQEVKDDALVSALLSGVAGKTALGAIRGDGRRAWLFRQGTERATGNAASKRHGGTVSPASKACSSVPARAVSAVVALLIRFCCANVG